MKQIEDRGYDSQFRHSGKTIIRIAANYSTEKNNIDTWKIERINPTT